MRLSLTNKCELSLQMPQKESPALKFQFDVMQHVDEKGLNYRRILEAQTNELQFKFNVREGIIVVKKQTETGQFSVRKSWEGRAQIVTDEALKRDDQKINRHLQAFDTDAAVLTHYLNKGFNLYHSCQFESFGF